MTKIEKRNAPPFQPDEALIKARFLAGASATEIAAPYPIAQRQSIFSFVTANTRRWLTEARWSRLKTDDRKTVVYRPVITRTGSRMMQPISLPANSLHRKQMQAEGRSYA